MRALLFPHEGWENVYKKRVRGESLSLDPSMRSSVRSESFYLKFRPEPCTGVSLRTDSLWWLQFPNPPPPPTPTPARKHAPLPALNLLWGLDWNLATLWHRLITLVKACVLDKENIPLTQPE